LLSIFEDYNARDTEIIVIDKGEQKLDYIIDKFESKINEGSLKILITTQTNKIEALGIATKITKGDYFLFLPSSTTLKQKTIEKLIISLDVLSPDIMETEIKLSGSISHKNKINENLKLNVLYDSKNTVKLYAYMSPFIYNKIIKTSLFNKVNNKHLTSEREILLIYQLLNQSETFLFIDEPSLSVELKEEIDLPKKTNE
jgi:hypothetical protein